MSEIFVYIDLQQGPVLVGRLWPRMRHGREPSLASHTILGYFDLVSF
jgi:hypothetical protein